jgi:hypothetical protein
MPPAGFMSKMSSGFQKLVNIDFNFRQLFNPFTLVAPAPPQSVGQRFSDLQAQISWGGLSRHLINF